MSLAERALASSRGVPSPNTWTAERQGESYRNDSQVTQNSVDPKPTVVLRWKSSRKQAHGTGELTSSRADGDSSQAAYPAYFAETYTPVRSEQAALPDENTLHYRRLLDNPQVQTVNYQQDSLTPQTESFGESLNQPELINPPPSYPELTPQAEISPNDFNPPLPQTLPYTDPLNAPESAPDPRSILDQTPLYPEDNARTNPFEDDPEFAPMLRGKFQEQPENWDLPPDDRSAISCNELRDRVRSRPLSHVSLDVSPSYGEGLRTVRKDGEDLRLEFAANSAVRDWTDYKGLTIATGRLIDLKDDRVILDVDGQERAIAIHDLSDADLTYVGESWNIPLRCGTGNEPFEGRSFVTSMVQWKAPGTCHKPLYFEQPQLERYGHEVGPILQPLLSTAHFFVNIAVVPYKMGIHPPNECQYSLGYLRPGNCNPYMLQPIPLSLRGVASQASVVSGAFALIP